MTTSSLLNARYLRPFVLSWLAWIIIHAAVLVWLEMELQYAIADSLVYNLLMIGCAVFQVYIMQYYFPKKDRAAYVIVASLGFALIATSLGVLLMRILFTNEAEQLSFQRNAFPVRFGISLLLASCVTMINILVYTLREEQTSVQRSMEAEKLSKDAELFQLRSQLQPHFLFNSLNSISALAGSKPEQARQMIQQLSDFLRGTIRKDNAQMITLDEECKHLRLYLEIEKVRFGHRLEAEITYEPACGPLKIPSLLLQPVLENAIKFGLYDTLDAVHISIQAHEQIPYLVIQVSNPFDKNTQPAKGTGFGLTSVQRRLYLLYSRNDLLKTTQTDTTFTTTLIIPQSA